MGQQQLLLLVLGTLIVGLAVVGGVQMFDQSQKQSNMDSLSQDGVRIAADAQAWYSEPEQFGGGGQSYDGISFNDMGYRTGNTVAGNEAGADEHATVNGIFRIESASGDQLQIVGDNAREGNEVTVDVTGASQDSIFTTRNASF